MNEFLIDTDILSYYMRDIPHVVTQVQKHIEKYGLFNLSSLTVFEILKGLRKKELTDKENTFQEEIVKHNVIGLGYDIMDKAATLIVELEKKGTPLPYGDLFIGATALTHNLILVTNNTGHFSKIEGLDLENWMEA